MEAILVVVVVVGAGEDTGETGDSNGGPVVLVPEAGGLSCRLPKADVSDVPLVLLLLDPFVNPLLKTGSVGFVGEYHRLLDPFSG